jgi:hypothetical protein
MTLTKTDLNNIRTIVKEEVDESLEEKLDEQELKFEKKLTEFKSDFFEKIDPILKEVTTAREERPIFETRLEVLEEKVGIHST